MKSGDLLRLGVLGLSDGNGHPYSWSAIFNGYDPVVMASCPFPVIPDYLSRQPFPEACIEGAKVTHIWTQDRTVSEHVAAASLISSIVDDYQAMIGEVDGILLARDDAENHLEMSVPFLNAGLPIYIDKPIALDSDTLSRICERQLYPGQLFSCSALRFSGDLQLSPQDIQDLGEVRHVEAVVPKSWEKYGIHAIEPVLNMLGLNGAECEVQAIKLNEIRVVTAKWNRISASFTCLGTVPGDIRIRLFGVRGQKEKVFRDTYIAFKRALEVFVEGIRTGRDMIPRADLYGAVAIIEKGLA